MKVRIQAPCLAAFDVVRGIHFISSATPIDDKRTWLWIRYSQRFVPKLLGGRLLARLIALMDYAVTIRSQDVPVMSSQRDDPTDISGYQLFEADRGVALFFSLRRRLLREAAQGRFEAA